MLVFTFFYFFENLICNYCVFIISSIPSSSTFLYIPFHIYDFFLSQYCYSCSCICVFRADPLGLHNPLGSPFLGKAFPPSLSSLDCLQLLIQGQYLGTESHNLSEDGEYVIVECLDPNGMPPTPKTQETSQKIGWENSKFQKTKMPTVRQ